MATITYAHGPDHAVVSFTGELDWDAVRELVDTVELLAKEYFYSTVELLVTSPGGNVRSFEHYLARQAVWRRHGVRVRTRVICEAASAAALLVSLGDERIADPGATLSYHCTHLSPEGVNAEATAAISSVLREMDEGFIARLAVRGLECRAEVAHGAERADRELLRQLWPVLGRSGGGEAPVKVRKLARGVGRYVDQAVRGADREALARLYRRLFETESRLSARLALTLRLLDRIGPEPVTARTGQGAEGLTIAEWAVLYPPDGTVPRDVLTRHALVLGETGSGKTASCILPVTAAIARAPRERLGAALVIDPKRELARTLEALAPERLHRVDAHRAVLNVMSGPRWDLEADLAARRWVSAARRILCRVASFVPSSPAKVLVRHEPAGSNTNKDFFDREGTALAQTILALVLMLIHHDTPAPGQWLEHDLDASGWVDDLLARARSPGDECGPNVMALAAWALEGPLLVRPEPQRAITISAQPGEMTADPGWLFGRIAHAVLASLCDESPEGRDLCQRVLGYWTAMACADTQSAGVRASANTVFADFAAPSLERTVYFGCEPGHASARSNGDRLDFARLVAAQQPGALVLFQPARDGLDNLIAVSLKALFFEAVLDDPDRAAGRADLPLVGYVADEFHRFVTSDLVHGEQSFLDTCRSYGAFCVLACQSVASIEHALAHGGGTAEQNRSSVEILWQNTATKLVLRSTDPKTAQRVGELSPSRSGLDPVVRVRPVSTLAPGECYAVLADGRFERRQLGRFVEPAKAPERPAPLLEGPSRAAGRS